VEEDQDKERVLIEKHDIRSMRVSYLTSLKKYKADGRPIILEDDTFMEAIPDRKIGRTIMIPVCWCQHRKARDLSFFMLEDERTLFQTHFSCINLGRKPEIITMKWTVKIMPAG
jgi:hypothetical protein